ncbi:hypothetical protein H9L13_01215 [Sphingomonas lutea]|uniref:DUF3617 family protein n=1 Tax=Sphingomonas lutea TaxID=1045317 RepID=A0A7G9SID5_9SPHN|nr:hypothetical protein [Sphingomonas lutea]QNN67610.1 hypothetical protein H9L13_01215 [Sphingomonas lutea]
MRAIAIAFLLLGACRDAVAPTAAPDRTAQESAPDAPAAATPIAKAPAAAPAKPTHPCLVQDGRPVAAPALRAIGTEPFWGATTHGRCVTYSTPDDQAGTRVWAKVRQADGGRTVWTGALRGTPFELSIAERTDCSDGMSDNRYPLEARLLVDGEERRGCARPAPTGR